MNINMTGQHVEITEALRDFTNEKFSRIVNHFSKITNINVIFGVEKHTQFAEATVNVPNHQFHAKAEHDDLYAAIDLLIEKIKKQIVKQKEKDTDHH